MTLTEKAIARVFERWAKAYPAWAEGGAPFASDRWIWAAGECERAANLAERIWLRRERTHLRALVSDLRDRSPCWFDHHGFCQGHGWMDASPCPHARAARLLGVAR